MKNQSFKSSFVLAGVITRQTNKYVQVGQDLRKIKVLMLCHKYDNSCLYLTLPLIYENDVQFPKRDIAAVRNVFSKVQEKV
jgi:hypothetical protein